MRLFAAAFPPRDAIDKIVSVQKAVASRSQGRASWTSLERMHITLGFYGDSDLNDMLSFVKERTIDVQAFECKLVSVRAFPNMTRAKVCFIGPEKEASLQTLCDRLPIDKKKPAVPHITLARLREPGKLSPVSFDPIAFSVTEVLLVESFLGPKPRYEIRERFPPLKT